MKKKNEVSNKILGDIIKKARIDKKMEIYDLVRFIKSPKVTKSTIKKWENGTDFPNLDEIYKLSEIFELNPNELLEIRQKIRESHVNKPNWAARRIGGKALKLAEPGFRATSAFIQILAALCVFFLYQYIHASYDVIEAPLVEEVENTFEYYKNSFKEGTNIIEETNEVFEDSEIITDTNKIMENNT